jgi:hypothetical protein
MITGGDAVYRIDLIASPSDNKIIPGLSWKTKKTYDSLNSTLFVVCMRTWDIAEIWSDDCLVMRMWRHESHYKIHFFGNSDERVELDQFMVFDISDRLVTLNHGIAA